MYLLNLFEKTVIIWKKLKQGEIMELNSDKISQNYQSILEDIKKYSPYPEKVKILFVSKYLNIEEQETLINMGYSYFGENRAQVYRDKMERFSSEKYENLIWDFIGRLQKNKIKYIITNINLIHSIDSFDLLAEINKKAVENNRIVNESEKYFSMSNVKIKGFMTMAPLDAEIDEIDGYFSKMYNLKKEYEKKYSYCNELSMGMSNDYIEALKNGATILRIGSRLYW